MGGGLKPGNLEQTYILDVPLWVELNGGVIFMTILLHFHYFISLETANAQKSEVFFLRISFGNVNASVVIANMLKFTISVLKKIF